RHRPLGQLMLGEKRFVGFGEHIDNRIADGNNIEIRNGRISSNPCARNGVPRSIARQPPGANYDGANCRTAAEGNAMSGTCCALSLSPSPNSATVPSGAPWSLACWAL